MLDPRELERRKAAEAERQREQQEVFSKARQLLVDLIALPDLQKVFDDEWCDNAKCVYQQAPTLTLLILQRLGGGLSLSAAVEELLKHHRDILPRNRRVTAAGCVLPCGLAGIPSCRRCEWEAISTRPEACTSPSCSQVMKLLRGTGWSP